MRNYRGTAFNVAGSLKDNLSSWLNFNQQVADKRWKVLYSRDNHYLLQGAIIRQLIINEDSHRSNKKNSWSFFIQSPFSSISFSSF
jgi:hypothetical protein